MNNKLHKVLFLIIFIVCLVAATSCSNNSASKSNDKIEDVKSIDQDSLKNIKAEQKDQWKCPLKCEGDKSYDARNPCPECGEKMKIVEL